MKRIGILLAVSCLMGGCGVYNKYSRSDMDVDIDSLYREPMTTADTTTIASMPWREFFTDSRLQALIAAGLECNTDLGITRLQVAEAQAVLTNARLSYLPSLNLTPQAGVSRYNGNTQKTYNLGATASWEADIFGKTTNAKRGAAAALEQRHAYRQAVRRARADRAEIEASMLTLRKSIGETENSLCALLKEPSHAVSRGTLDGQTFPDTLSTGVPLQLLANRPDVRQAEAALAEAFYATNAARSAFYPSLTLSGTLGWTNNGGGGIVNPGKWISNAIAQLTAPLFNKGTNIANLKIAEARRQEAALAFEQSLLDAGNEVNNALVEWQTADGRIRLDEQQIRDLEAATEKTLLLMRYTPVNYLEVLTAQQSLLTARLTLAQDRIAGIRGIIHLYHALGGGKD